MHKIKNKLIGKLFHTIKYNYNEIKECYYDLMYKYKEYKETTM